MFQVVRKIIYLNTTSMGTTVMVLGVVRPNLFGVQTQGLVFLRQALIVGFSLENFDPIQGIMTRIGLGCGIPGYIVRRQGHLTTNALVLGSIPGFFLRTIIYSCLLPSALFLPTYFIQMPVLGCVRKFPVVHTQTGHAYFIPHS